MISGIHGQMEPLALAFAAAAFLYARREHPSWAGAMLGLAIAAKTWPVLIGAGLLRAVGNNTARFRAMVVAAAVPVGFLLTYRLFVETSVRDTLTRVAGYASYAGEWGWTGLVRLVAGYERFLELSEGMASAGRWLTMGGLLLAWFAWRRADPLDLTAAVLLTFLVVTPGFGAQYLLWPVPFLIARPTRRTVPFLGVASVWAAFGYLVVGDFGYYVLWQHSGWWDYETVHLPWVAASLLVVVTCLAVFPWERRRPRSVPGLSQRPVGAADRDHTQLDHNGNQAIEDRSGDDGGRVGREGPDQHGFTDPESRRDG
jgi:hypothetical protein